MATEPTPDQARPWWASFVFSLVLFSLSYSTNCVQRERQSDELRRQGRQLEEIRAKLEERDSREERRHQGPR